MNQTINTFDDDDGKFSRECDGENTPPEIPTAYEDKIWYDININKHV